MCVIQLSNIFLSHDYGDSWLSRNWVRLHVKFFVGYNFIIITKDFVMREFHCIWNWFKVDFEASSTNNRFVVKAGLDEELDESECSFTVCIVSANHSAPTCGSHALSWGLRHQTPDQSITCMHVWFDPGILKFSTFFLLQYS